MIAVQSQYCPQNHRCPTLGLCPTGAVKQDGYRAPTIDAEICTECGRCVSSCGVFKEVAEAVPAAGGGARGGKNGSLGGMLDPLSRRPEV